MKKGKWKRHLAEIIGIVLLLFFLIIFLYKISGGGKVTITTYLTQLSVEQETVLMEGYLFRSETVLTKEPNQVVRYSVADGEKVSKGTCVARVMPCPAGSDPEEIRERLRELDEKINLLTKAASIVASAYDSPEALEARIDEVYASLLSEKDAGNRMLATEEYQEMLALLYRKSEESGGKTVRSQIESLQVEKDQILFSSLYLSEDVNSPESGYFYQELDGFETLMTSETARAMTYTEFQTIRKSTPRNNADAWGKIVSDYSWYLAVPVSEELADGMEEGKTYVLKFEDNNGKELSLLYERLIAGLAGERVLLLRCDTMPLGFHYERTQTVRFVTQTYSGYRVPKAALVKQDGTDGVFIIDSDRKAHFRRVEILYETDMYWVVAPNGEEKADYLSENDLIVLSEKELKEGQVIG